MTILGQLSLLMAFAGSGYAAFACIAGALTCRDALRRGGRYAGYVSITALTVALTILVRALYVKDFEFAYVAQYSSRLLPWYYALSALWVGQAGSLLLWAWMLAALSLIFNRRAVRRGKQADQSADGSPSGSEHLTANAFGLLMAYLCFLTATMVFAADPMEPSIARLGDGSGLSPLLQHPAMLIHPPVVFLGYAIWAIPCALTIAALAVGGLDRRWLQQVRPWALAAWMVLGIGILLGAQWSYEELGWGGYWAWDPVENASLIPWLTGTAFIHTIMAWRARGILKKTAASLAVATFGLCNFATFLTRSGIFSSLHAFSRSPIGWLFLALMIVLGLAVAVLIVARRSHLAPENPVASLFSSEAMVSILTVSLLLLAASVIVGTLFVALSEAITGRRVLVGPEFYNNALISTGLVFLAAMAPAPLFHWGCAPSSVQKIALAVSAGAASLMTGFSWVWGARHPLLLCLVWIASCAFATFTCRVFIDLQRYRPARFWERFSTALGRGRRQYAGFMAHLGFFLLALGVAGSSLGTHQREFDLVEGETVRWAGRSIQFARLAKLHEPDKIVVEAELVISTDQGNVYTLRPAQNLYKQLDVWTTEASIYPTWRGDFYTILQNGEGTRAHFTFKVNPLMRWIWFGGGVMGLAVLVGLWPEQFVLLRRREGRSSSRLPGRTPQAPIASSTRRPVASTVHRG